MGSLVFHEFKRQASFFFKEKIKTARLALTDVTPVELLTEEATNGNMISPNACHMAAISRAAFEVDDYWRIVDILHKRLSRFDTKNWRVSYNALILLEYFITHGPLRVAEEFQSDKDSIKEMGNFQFIDEKRFDWGLSVRKLSEKILMLLENESFFKEERTRARKLTMGIKGFGSFSHQLSSSKDENFNCLSNHRRFNYHYYDHENHEDQDFFLEKHNYNQNNLAPEKLEINGDWLLKGSEDGNNIEREHPFSEYDRQATQQSLLSAIM